ncbi:type III polyketide synthase [Herbiconiux flava]|uniref:Putative naringenin-chalcone synthase n=1 Tax=Herbiconiux flava TaxID=881268 RepID=A0A852SRL4_9MICO|nr:type III polyketide synthase [Herbiconiux flava]NYD71598.1 putative naringenin-chalcone synthase [Herbiconiux flava]GLK18438.1 naringenin-chalcone synthase [Herbiconiux flava]
MAASIRSIQTAVPRTELAQERVRDLFAAQPGLTRLGQRLVATSFDSSGIRTRHTVLDELAADGRASTELFVDAATGAFSSPSTGERNRIYVEQAPGLAVTAAKRALDALAPGITAADVTHVVTASCTGFFAPGPDWALQRELGLSDSVQRHHVGFMGCYAAFPALRIAKAFCEADPDAVVLVVCVELCTLHVRSSNEPDQIVASSVFADGAAAAVVTARETGASAYPTLALDEFASAIVPDGEADMAWTIGDHGFEMVLSSYVPKIIEQNIRTALEPLLGQAGAEAATHWAIHPGGRSILDRVEQTLGLTPAQLAPSREVLRDYGNMSSATVLFVLKGILDQALVTGTTDARPASSRPPERVCAMAFGPGLTVESGLFTLRPAG